MSKALYLGMPLFDVIKAATANAAEAMGEAGNWGCLSAGSIADITILRLKEGKYPLIDARGVVRTADKLLIPVCTISNGQVFYRNPEFLC